MSRSGMSRNVGLVPAVPKKLEWYTNEAAIIAQYPTGTNGQSVGNGETDTIWVWDADTAAWVDTGGGGGAGDMEAATYDPTAVAGDAFDMDNMAEGATNLILTSAERTTIGNQSGTNTGDQDLTKLDAISYAVQRVVSTALPTAILVTDGAILFDTTSTAIAISLPTASVGMVTIPFKDIGGNAATNNITINAVGADTIVDVAAGQTSTIIVGDGFSGAFSSNGIDTWYLTYGDFGGGGLDSAAVTALIASELADSPVLVSPALGTPASGVLTYCTGLPKTAVTGAGFRVQELHQNILADFTTGVAIPLDDSGPTPSEMALYASQVIAPTNATSLIVVDARLMAEISNGQCFFAAVFVDSETTPKGVFYSSYVGAGEYSRVDPQLSFVAGTTSAITVKIYVAMRVSATLYMGHCTGATGDLGNTLTNSLNVAEVLQ